MITSNKWISDEAVSTKFLHLNICGFQDLSDKDHSCVRENGRADYHLLYIVRGKCTAELNGKKITVSEGGLILFKPFEKQIYSFKKEDATISYYIHFTGNYCEELISYIYPKDKSVVYLKKSNTIDTILEKMSNEYISQKPFYSELCSAYLLELLTVIRRKLLPENTSSLDKCIHPIESVCLTMHNDYNKNIPIKQYADFCGLSVSQFYRVFKTFTGMSPHDYVLQARINKAKDFLLYSNLSVSKIADITGFSNQNYFGRMFKKYTGVSPKNFSKS